MTATAIRIRESALDPAKAMPTAPPCPPANPGCTK
jgi:hypothetical protein